MAFIVEKYTKDNEVSITNFDNVLDAYDFALRNLRNHGNPRWIIGTDKDSDFICRIIKVNGKVEKMIFSS